MSNKASPVTLKEWSYMAIAKHSRKIFKYQTRVLQDKDPEDLHQMRVGMRRLRSAVVGLAAAVDLPQTVTEKNLAKLGRSVGRLRDLDVLLATLTDDYRPLLPQNEQKNLDRVINYLRKQRRKEVKQVRKTLEGKLYFHLEQELKNWLDRPEYQTIGECSLAPLLPDLLLPQISQFLLHPGWFVGVEFEEGQIQFPQILNQEAIEQLLNSEDALLHDLRKSAKKTRYNLELFSQLYGDTYHRYLHQIEQLQEVLGQIQDAYVLRKVLEKVLKSAIAEQMPELANLCLKTRYQNWLEWQNLQKQFLEQKIREEFRQAIILEAGGGKREAKGK
ncbi:CHAD domain-containing protein [Pleurocapsales cyanobacterium LEGE 10410]|nr:CHAD domain-containing protein [Pleurocapsales cyanobacterium LEGE 10410]